MAFAAMTTHTPSLHPISTSSSHHPSRANSYFSNTTGSQSGTSTPISGSYTPASAHFPQTPGSTTSSHHNSAYHGHGASYAPQLDIQLESDEIILRGAGSDYEPALLRGNLVLNLTESTNIKALDMKLEGKARVVFSEGGASSTKSHHFTHPILNHDWSFLEGGKSHSHTLKAGQHVFPFSFTFNGNLPSTIRTYLNDAHITYKLKATAHRSAFQHNFHAAKNISVIRGFTGEALEYNQTLEIENTWPGKVMYCLTLPHKAYAAGDEIPVNIKFMPLAKGTRVTHVTSVIKEYTLVHTRHSSHPEVRVAAQTKHELREGRAFKVTERGSEAVAPAHHFETAGTGGFHGMMSAPPSAPPSPTHRPTNVLGLPHGFGSSGHSSGIHTPASDLGGSRVGSHVNLQGLGQAAAAAPHSAAASYFGFGGSGTSSGNATPGPSGGNGSGQVAAFPDDMREPEEDLNIGDEEINTMITIPVPAWTTPSHNIHPVFVTHKIKWSCAISNPDGHVSELRCALPIHILSNSLLDEAQTHTSGTRALLFGGDQEEVTHVDLPSYNDHVYDRVANASGANTTTTYVATGRRTPGTGSAGATPAGSRAPSRAPSRHGSPRLGATHAPAMQNLDIPDDLHLNEDGPPRPPVPQLDSWADSELMMSLGVLARHQGSSGSSPHDTPPESRTPSRPGSRMGFRSGRNSNAGSRAGSRASSPERGPTSGSHSAGGALATGATNLLRPLHERRSSGHHSGGGGLFHMPKPFTSLAKSRHASAANSAVNSPMPSPGLSPSAGGALPRAGFSLGSHAAFTSLAEANDPNGGGSGNGSGEGSGRNSGTATPVDPLSQVPSYDVARVGFLGGGVTPLSAAPPRYEEAAGPERAKSETDLTQLARAAETQGTSISALLNNLQLESSAPQVETST